MSGRAVGKVYYDPSQGARGWVIETEPHVALRLKRVFAKLGSYARNRYLLSDTPENARDLLWFLERYPMALDDSRRLEQRAKEHEAQQKLVEDLLAKRLEMPPFDLAVPAREYQKEAAAMLLAAGGLLLCDDLGLGKTVSAIATFCSPKTLPAVVITETALPEQWRRMTARFAPNLWTHVIQTGQPPQGFTGVCKSRHEMREDKQAEGGGRCRKCAEVGRELPALQNVLQPCEADARAIHRETSQCAELARFILGQGPNPLAGNAADKKKSDHMLASEQLINKLRQATGIAKAHFVAEFVKLILETDEPVVLFGWHRAVYDIWIDRLKEYRPVLYTGTETAAQKLRAVRRFLGSEEDGERSRVLIISLRSGAGLDGLQHGCRTVVYGELDWSPKVHDQCLSIDTEVLTPTGFKGCNDVNVGDEVAAFDVETGAIRWCITTRKTDRPVGACERMFELRTRRTNVRVTGDHRMVVRRKTRTTAGTGRSPWEVVTAQDLAGQSRRFVPISGLQSAPGVPLTDFELRLLGWFITDGHFNGRFLAFFQAVRQPWNADLVEVLDGCGLRWTRHQVENAGGPLFHYCVQKGTGPKWQHGELAKLRFMLDSGMSYRKIATVIGRSEAAIGKRARRLRGGDKGAASDGPKRGWLELEPYLDKDLSPLLDDMTREQLKQFLRGVYMGDGNKAANYKGTLRITNTNKTFLDRLQSLCVRRGMSARIARRKSKTSAGRYAYDIYISDSVEAIVARPGKRNAFAESPRDVDERVWCLTNELGTLVTRRGGRVTIVGNCTGRVFRDGQPHPVVAYYLVADKGSDPIVSDVLGLKESQSHGILEPTSELVEQRLGDADHAKKLAEAYLAQLRGGNAA